jgi:hypothetical protein
VVGGTAKATTGATRRTAMKVHAFIPVVFASCDQHEGRIPTSRLETCIDEDHTFTQFPFRDGIFLTGLDARYHRNCSWLAYQAMRQASATFPPL